MSNNQTLSIKEAASQLHMHPYTLHQWRRKGYIECIQMPNGRFVVPASEIERLTSKPEEVA